MVDRRVTEDTAILGAAVAAGDLFDLVDVSDTTDAATGTNKKILASEVALALISLGSIATDAEVTAAVAALSSVYQPLDADLTAIAALTTTAFGRGLLILADASAARTALSLVPGTDVEAHDTDLTTIAGLAPSNDDVIQRKAGAWANRTIAQLLVDLAAPGTTFQPLDSDLTAIAALTTTAYGRALLTLANAAASDWLPLAAGGAVVNNVGNLNSNTNTVAATGSTETLDTSLYAVHDCTMDQNCTFTFSNPIASGKNTTFMLILRGAFTPTLPGSVKWSSGSVPTYTTPSVYVFSTIDGGKAFA